MCTLFTNLYAVRVENMPFTLTQPDGTTFDCFITGDEFSRRIHDENNFTLIKNSETGNWVYARSDGENLIPTKFKAGSIDPEAVGLTPNLYDNMSVLKEKIDNYFAPLDTTDYQSPTTGVLNNLVIFIRFSDQANFTAPISVYDSDFNTGAVSLKSYYTSASYSQLTVNSHFYPTQNQAYIVSYQDGNPRSYYQAYNASTNPGGYISDTDARIREHTLLQSACGYVASMVPPTLNIDGDSDGMVDNTCFMIQGVSDGWSDLLWPHMWSLYTYNVTINGKRVYTYNFNLTDFAGGSTGVLCHEMGHSLGCPDLYHYYTAGTPVGPWSLMASNGSTPQNMLAIEKQKYMGWIPPMTAITTSGTYTLNPLGTSSTNNCYKIASPYSATEYFTVEYRKNTTTFESALPGSGLIVSRINPAYTGNAYGPPDEIYIYRPDGTVSVNGLHNEANFSTEEGRTAISDATNPSSFLTDGSPGGLNIWGIGSATGATISFNYGSTTPQIALNPSTLSFSGEQNGTLPSSKTFDVSNLGGGTLSWTATEPMDWLSVNPGSGTNSGTVTVNITTTNKPPGVYTTNITVSGNATNSPQTVAITYTVWLELPAYLLVPDWDNNVDNTSYYTNALDANSYSYDVWDRVSPLTTDVLKQYQCVIWFTSDDVTNVLLSGERTTLQEYLNSGGNLFFSGQDLGYNSNALGYGSWYNSYFYSTYIGDNVGYYGVNGVAADLITNGMDFHLTSAVYAQGWFPSEIDPISPAVSIFYYDPSQTSVSSELNTYMANPTDIKPDTNSNILGVIQSSGTAGLKIDNGTYKLVYLAFGFETIIDASGRATLMDNILNWLNPGTPQDQCSPNGAIIYNTDTGKFNFCEDGVWVEK
ncbi:M6 family metalloprotease domain-containing protein [Candidatus Neomarinimicrobiota bacterium]